MPSTGVFHIVVDPVDAGTRLDLLVASRVSALTRSQAALLIQHGQITVNDLSKKPGYRLQAKDEITGRIPPPADSVVKPEPLALDILHEDDDLIVLNKPAGVVVHPAPGHASGTLVNALLYHCPTIGPIGGELRPGIVHRLDKDTSGILVVAKNAAAHAHLAGQFAARSIRKIYLAVVFGEMADDSGVIELPIGRHPVDRKRMSTSSRKPRMAENALGSARAVQRPDAGRIEFENRSNPSGPCPLRRHQSCHPRRPGLRRPQGVPGGNGSKPCSHPTGQATNVARLAIDLYPPESSGVGYF